MSEYDLLVEIRDILKTIGSVIIITMIINTGILALLVIRG